MLSDVSVNVGQHAKGCRLPPRNACDAGPGMVSEEAFRYRELLKPPAIPRIKGAISSANLTGYGSVTRGKDWFIVVISVFSSVSSLVGASGAERICEFVWWTAERLLLRPEEMCDAPLRSLTLPLLDVGTFLRFRELPALVMRMSLLDGF